MNFSRKDGTTKKTLNWQRLNVRACLFWTGWPFHARAEKKKEPRQSKRFKKNKKNLLTDTSQVSTLWKVARRETYWSPNISASGENIYDGENVVLLWHCPSLRRRLGEDSWWCRRWGSASRLKDTDSTRWRTAADTLTAIEKLCGVEETHRRRGRSWRAFWTETAFLSAGTLWSHMWMRRPRHSYL